MKKDVPERRSPQLLEENLKKALTELLILYLLASREYYIGELTDVIRERSGGTLSISFPYAVIYRMTRSGYIVERGKRNAPDGRLRQYYGITDNGREYLSGLLDIYTKFTKGVSIIIEGENHDSSGKKI